MKTGLPLPSASVARISDPDGPPCTSAAASGRPRSSLGAKRHGLAVVFFLGASFLLAPALHAATLHTILTNGPAANRINLVVLSEGYTSSQSGKFLSDATNTINALLSGQPFLEYRRYFNAYAIWVASSQSGSDHPVSSTFVSTYFNSSYDPYYDYFITIPDGPTGQGRVEQLLQNHFPAYDLAILVVNDIVPGGSGGRTLITSLVDWQPYIVVHEAGHSLAGLGDEYTSPFPYPDLEEPNTTRETNRNLIKWKAWIEPGTPIPTPETAEYYDVVGLFEGAHYHETGWYRPKMDCTMNSYAAPFCEVCREALTLSFYQRARPLDAFAPAHSNVTFASAQAQSFTLTLLQPQTHGLSVQWLTNGVVVAGATGPALTLSPRDLGNGSGTVQARIKDETPFVRTDPTNLLMQAVTWTVNVNIPELRLDSVRRLGSQGFSFRITGHAPQGFAVEASSNFSDWLSLTTNFLVNGQFTSTNFKATPWRFFRARTPP